MLAPCDSSNIQQSLPEVTDQMSRASSVLHVVAPRCADYPSLCALGQCCDKSLVRVQAALASQGKKEKKPAMPREAAGKKWCAPCCCADGVWPVTDSEQELACGCCSESCMQLAAGCQHSRAAQCTSLPFLAAADYRHCGAKHMVCAGTTPLCWTGQRTTSASLSATWETSATTTC